MGAGRAPTPDDAVTYRIIGCAGYTPPVGARFRVKRQWLFVPDWLKDR